MEKGKGNPPCQWAAFSRSEGFEHAFILSAIPDFSLINFESWQKKRAAWNPGSRPPRDEK